MGGSNTIKGTPAAYQQLYNNPSWGTHRMNSFTTQGFRDASYYALRNSAGYKQWAAQQSQAQRDAYNASVSNAQALAAQGQQAARQQISGYKQIGSLKDTSRSAISKQEQIRPVTQAPSQGIGQPSAPQQQATSVPKGLAQVNPAGAQAAQAAVSNQLGTNQNQFTSTSASGIKLGGS